MKEPAEQVPQAEQTVFELARQGVVWNVTPETQEAHAVQTVLDATLQALLTQNPLPQVAHPEQTVFENAAHAARTKLEEGHVWQLAQKRLVNAVGAMVWYCDEVQTVSAAHPRSEFKVGATFSY